MKNKLDIAFVGDISVTGIFKNLINHKIEIFDEKLIRSLSINDFVVSNLEGPVTNSKCYIRNNGLVVSPEGSISYLNERGFNVFNMANNHMFDNGIIGYNDTITQLRASSCTYFGAGLNELEASKPLILEKNDVKIALIGFCHNEGMIADNANPGAFCIDNNIGLLKKRISYSKENADWVILNYHGGEEFSTLPMPSRRKLLHKLIKLDHVDMIICHHSHSVQGYEYVEQKPIFYSLGNFIFDIEPHKNKYLVNQGIILNFEFSENNYEFRFIPTKIDKKQRKIVCGNQEFLEKKIIEYSDFSTYWRKWLKDAHRSFFMSEKPGANNDKKGKRYKPVRKLIFDRNSLNRLIHLLKSENLRPIFLGGIAYKILTRLGFKL